MSTMKIVENPSGLIPVELKLVVEQPIDELVAGEKIWQGDFIKDVHGTVRRCGIMGEATHVAMHSVEEGSTVKCVKFDDWAKKS